MELVVSLLIAIAILLGLFGVLLLGMVSVERWLGSSFQLHRSDATLDVRLTDTDSDREGGEADNVELKDGCHLGGCLGKPAVRAAGDGREWTSIRDDGIVVRNRIVVGGTPPDLE